MNWMNMVLFGWHMMILGVFIYQQAKDKKDNITFFTGVAIFSFLAVISIFV